jgi:hypothetical protein
MGGAIAWSAPVKLDAQVRVAEWQTR